jgi:MFS family permease
MTEPIAPTERRCIACQSSLATGASICPVCKSWQSRWRNALVFLGGSAGARTALAPVAAACHGENAARSAAVAIAAFLSTQNEAGLFLIAAAYGFGFSGIIPAYVVAVRDLFPSSEASWRVPLVLFTSMTGMAFGSWFAGALYDHFGHYAPAFASGVLFNVLNLALVGFLGNSAGAMGISSRRGRRLREEHDARARPREFGPVGHRLPVPADAGDRGWRGNRRQRPPPARVKNNESSPRARVRTTKRRENPFRGQVDGPATSRRIFPPRRACATASLMEERG